MKRDESLQEDLSSGFADEDSSDLTQEKEQEQSPKKAVRTSSKNSSAVRTSNNVRGSNNSFAFPFFSRDSSGALSESNFEVVEASETDDKKNEAVREVNEAARREIRGVRLWKAVFLFTVVATAGIVSAGTYIFVQEKTKSEYEESYELFVLAMNDAVKVHVTHVVTVFNNLADMISSDAEGQGAEFPFYTMNNFEAVGEGIRALSNVEMHAWMPYVEAAQIPAWLNYSNTNQGWLPTSRKWALRSGEYNVINQDYLTGPITPFLFDLGGPGGTPQLAGGTSPYAPVWQTSPPVFNPQTINLDFNFYEFARTGQIGIEEARKGVFTRILIAGDLGSVTDLIVKASDHEKFHTEFVDWNETDHDAFFAPHFVYIQPVFQDAQNKSSKIVGYIAVAMTWDAYMTNLLPEGVSGIYAVVKNTCNQSITYRITGNRAYFEGRDDLHDRAYDGTERVIPFSLEASPEDYKTATGECMYSYHMYSSQEFEDRYDSNLAVILTCVVAGAFAFLILCFLMYDWFVQRRNTKVVNLAAKSNEIVSSLFPKQVRDRLYNKSLDKKNKNKKAGFQIDDYEPSAHGGTERHDDYPIHQSNLGAVLEDPNMLDEEGFMYKSAPIADVYPACTIMFADIVGFTAWSSAREPTQVFRLLETLYKAFDTFAKRRRVFKVETIGDCYVAVAGLPEPMSDHAVVMCRFAKDCLSKMRELTRRLESVLGPDTMDLDMRFGLHSGSCTAGVLRGEKSRFQLFGDTMNTASRMESTGRAGMVQISQETADFLIAAGKGHWAKPREDKVNAKGKGMLQTYWVSTSNRDYGSDSGHGSISPELNIFEKENTTEAASFHESLGDLSQGASSDFDLTASQAVRRTESLVKWNVEVFTAFLKQIARQRVLPAAAPTIEPGREQGDALTSPLKEFQDSIDFPMPTENNGTVGDLSPEVHEQLELFIHSIGSIYPNHPFHNFSHASHLSLSVVKLLSQLKSDTADSDESELEVSPALLVGTDPLAQLACVFAALVQDIDHPGVPNFVLTGQEGRCASQLKSIDMAWKMLVETPDYADLRKAIFSSPKELKHFRQVFVQCTLATDLSDKEFSARRKARWEKAFGPVSLKESVMVRLNRQSTLLLEIIIQASNMIHTMQHWDVYSKWNGLLFQEVYEAYKAGRMAQDPSEQWYKAELSFLDKVAVPMLKQLSDCKAFKDGSVEAYAGFCKSNRRDWQSEGESIIEEMLAMFGDDDTDRGNDGAKVNVEGFEDNDESINFGGIDSDDDDDNIVKEEPFASI